MPIRPIRRSIEIAACVGAIFLGPLLAWPGCSTEQSAPEDEPVAEAYPTLSELYTAEQGVYSGCGPNNNVCHNSKQFPDLSTLGSILDDIDLPCNELQDKPERMHDLCERTGDLLVVGDAAIEVAWVAAVGDGPLPEAWRIFLAAPYPAPPGSNQELAFERSTPEGRIPVARISALSIEVEADPRSIVITVPPAGPVMEDDVDPARAAILLLAGAGVPADPAEIQVGDPNRNGTFGAALGGRLIKPGDPRRSFIIRRLTDPAAGPLMPLANCCHWSKASVRALWCWIAGLDEDGSNAFAPIDYARCPPGPAVDHLAYPASGEGCEASGMCPVQSTLPASSEPTWKNVYGNIMTRRCAGSGCHFDGGAPLDLGGDETAYTNLLHGGLVQPGDPDKSPLFQRVAASCAPGASCDRMPLGLDPLPEGEIEAIRTWIQGGAAR